MLAPTGSPLNQVIDKLVDSDVQDLVERTDRAWNANIRAQLRDTTGLKLSTDVLVKSWRGSPTP